MVSSIYTIISLVASVGCVNVTVTYGIWVNSQLLIDLIGMFMT